MSLQRDRETGGERGIARALRALVPRDARDRRRARALRRRSPALPLRLAANPGLIDFEGSNPEPTTQRIGGERGIRTLEGLLTLTPLAGVRLRPLGHLSGMSCALQYPQRLPGKGPDHTGALPQRQRRGRRGPHGPVAPEETGNRREIRGDFSPPRHARREPGRPRVPHRPRA